jgi:hypothetical protein
MVVARRFSHGLFSESGAAPNLFRDIGSLVNCLPKIRRAVLVGDSDRWYLIRPRVPNEADRAKDGSSR